MFIEVTELVTFDCVARKTGEDATSFPGLFPSRGGREKGKALGTRLARTLQKGLFYTIVQERGEHGLLLEHLTRGF